MIQNQVNLIIELDQLKSVYRKSVIADGSRYENSAEHSWHLAMALMAFKPLMPSELDFAKATQMALVHDICEIGAGDRCAYEISNSDSIQESTAKKEQNYLEQLKASYPQFGNDALLLWMEYENQTTLESKWVKLVDKLLPFILNVASDGKTWKEQGITYEMVIEHNQFINNDHPEVFLWMMAQLDQMQNKGII